MRKILSVIAAAALLCGCASVKPKDLTIGGPDDYGKYPETYQQIVTNHIRVSFKDPESVKDLTINAPIKFVHKYKLSIPGSVSEYCYLIGFFCNAKNSYGGYTGTEPHTLLVRDDKILFSR